MKITLTLAVILNLALATSIPILADTEVSGNVEGIWDLERSPYVASDTLIIRNGDSLTIEAGVEVRFEDNYPFFVYGNLSAVGTIQDSILFAPVNGVERWGGLRFLDPDSLTHLSFCVVTKGIASGGDQEIDSLGSGGNIFISGDNILFDNCRISDGRARSVGGGVMIWRGSPTFENCLINENDATTHGGGMGIIHGSVANFVDVIFAENISTWRGGALYISAQANPTFFKCDFIENIIGRDENPVGGAVSIIEASSPVFRKCRFVENSASVGGAFYIRDLGTNPLIEWCDFIRNAANDIERIGGAIYIRSHSGVEIRYCRFIGNDASFGGALYVNETPSCNIHHNLFYANGSLEGGSAIATSRNLQGQLMIRNCTFLNNRFTGLEPVANTAMARGESRILITSSIIWDNRPQFDQESDITVEYSNIIQGFEGEENSDENPMFYAADSTWLVLAGQSPCIDSGDPDLPADPDDSRNDRGWMYFPHNLLGGMGEILRADVTTRTRATVQLTLRNSTEVPVYVSPFDNWMPGVREAFCDVTGIIGDGEINGVAYTNDGYFLTGSNNGRSPNKIYHLDDNFNLRGQFNQPGGHDGEGFQDLATDGEELLFGGDDRQIVEFTTNGELGEQYLGPGDIDYYRCIGADFRNGHLPLDIYLAGDDEFIIRTDGDMWERDRIAIEDTIRAIGVKGNSRALYIVTGTETDGHLLSLVLPDENIIIPQYYLRTPEGHRIGGIEITQNLREGRGSLVGIWKADGDEGDKLFAENIYTSWLVIVPETKLIMPDEEAEWDVVFCGDQMPAGLYESVFFMTVNGYGEGGEVEANMLSVLDSAPSEGVMVPVSCSISAVYPNPFNNAARFSYSVPQDGMIYITLLDNSGRILQVLHNGFQQAGHHSGLVDGINLPSGNYFLRLTTKNGDYTAPIILTK